MKKTNIYYILWASALTALVGCSYHIENNLGEKVHPNDIYYCDCNNQTRTEPTPQLPNLRSYSSKDNIFSMVDGYFTHIKNCFAAIQNSQSVFNEKNVNRSVTDFIKFLKSNQQAFNNGTLLSLPMIDYSDISTDHNEASHLIRLTQHLISAYDDPEA